MYDFDRIFAVRAVVGWTFALELVLDYCAALIGVRETEQSRTVRSNSASADGPSFAAPADLLCSVPLQVGLPVAQGMDFSV